MAINVNLPSINESYANLAAFPATGSVRILYKALNNNNLYTWNGSTYVLVDKKFASSWGSLSDAPVTTTSVSKDDIGLGNVDNTSDVNKPISSATQTALNAKQATLVSATNIKTINGSSILGSGDLVVGGGGGGGIHAFVKPQTGETATVSVNSTAPSVMTVINNRLFTFAFIPAQSITCSGLYINCATAQVAALARILIYSDLNGLPNLKLYESSDLSLASNGLKTATTSFTFNAGTTYWLALHTSGTTALVSAHALAAVIPVRTTGLQLMTYLYPTSNPVFRSAPSPFGAVLSANTAIPFIGITSV